MSLENFEKEKGWTDCKSPAIPNMTQSTAPNPTESSLTFQAHDVSYDRAIDLKELGAALNTLRLALGVSQSDLFASAGYDLSKMAHEIELNIWSPRAESLVSVLSAIVKVVEERHAGVSSMVSSQGKHGSVTNG